MVDRRGEPEAPRLREHAAELHQVLAEEPDQRDDLDIVVVHRVAQAAERGADAVFALLLRAVVGDVLDGRDQRHVVVAEVKAVQVQLAAARKAQQQQHAGRIELFDVVGVDGRDVLGGLPQLFGHAGGVRERPAAEQAQALSGIAFDCGRAALVAHRVPFGAEHTESRLRRAWTRP